MEPGQYVLSLLSPSDHRHAALLNLVIDGIWSWIVNGVGQFVLSLFFSLSSISFSFCLFFFGSPSVWHLVISSIHSLYFFAAGLGLSASAGDDTTTSASSEETPASVRASYLTF